MTHSKLTHSFFLVAALGALALTSAGCAMNADEPTSEEAAQSTEADLRKAPVAATPTQFKLDEATDGVDNSVMPKAPVAPKLINAERLLGGGEEGDGPRPHPWEPKPENSETNTGSSGSSSSTK